MGIATIKETCVCGASFEATGSTSHCAFRYKDFLDAHAVCRKNEEDKKRNGKE